MTNERHQPLLNEPPTYVDVLQFSLYKPDPLIEKVTIKTLDYHMEWLGGISLYGSSTYFCSLYEGVRKWFNYNEDSE